MSNDRIDSNMEDLVEETAEELAVNAQEYSEEIEKTIANTDGDPCNRLEFLSEYSTQHSAIPDVLSTLNSPCKIPSKKD